MPQLATSAAKRRLYRQTFEIKVGGVSKYKHTLLLNPSDISVEEPNRASVTQTLGGAYVSIFGQGLHNITLSGTTGYNARMSPDGTMTDGYQEFQALRKLIYRNFITNFEPQAELFWYDWENEEYYKVMPMSFRLQRSVQEPNLYRYEIQMTTLQQLGAQTKPDSNNLLSAVKAFVKAIELGNYSSAISEALAKLNG